MRGISRVENPSLIFSSLQRSRWNLYPLLPPSPTNPSRPTRLQFSDSGRISPYDRMSTASSTHPSSSLRCRRKWSRSNDDVLVRRFFATNSTPMFLPAFLSFSSLRNSFLRCLAPFRIFFSSQVSPSGPAPFHRICISRQSYIVKRCRQDGEEEKYLEHPLPTHPLHSLETPHLIFNTVGKSILLFELFDEMLGIPQVPLEFPAVAPWTSALPSDLNPCQS